VGNIPYGDLVMKTIVLNGMSNKLIRDRAIKKISDGDLMNLRLLVDFISKEEKSFTCNNMKELKGDKVSPSLQISSVYALDSDKENMGRNDLAEDEEYTVLCGDCGLEEGDGSMIRCADCQELYHLDCVDLSQSELPFRCHHCKAHSGQSEWRGEGEGREGQFDCSICENRSFSNRSLLYRHYSESHFSEGLKRFIDLESLSCKICGIELKRLPYLVCHVGATHDRVEEFLDKSHLVPRKLAWSRFQEGPGYNCNFCEHEKIFPSKLKLYSHLSRCHFKENIQPYIDADNIQCLLCGVKVTRLNTLMSHVGVSHGKIEEFIRLQRETGDLSGVAKDRVTKARSYLSEITENLRKRVATSSRKDLVEDLVEEGLWPTFEDLACRLCPMENHFPSRKRLYKHYSQRHFKDNIMKLLGNNQLQCPDCSHESFTVSDLIVHLGSVHDKVDLFLDPEFQVPRLPRKIISQVDLRGIPLKKNHNNNSELVKLKFGEQIKKIKIMGPIDDLE